MNKNKGLLTGILCMILWLAAGTAWAGQGTVVENNGQTDVVAGVVVDYMGKLRFEVYQRGTTTPIEGASVELYIPSLDRYILFGLTDAEGAYELDIAYNMDPSANLEDQFQTVDGTLSFQGILLYLNSNEIRYQIYKSDWLPYPYQGTEILSGNQVPHVVTVYLYKKSTGGGGSGGGGSSTSSGGSSSSQDDPATLIEEAAPLAGLDGGDKTGGIPKTGVEGAVPYWIAGAAFFLLAGGILMFLWIKEQEIKNRERRYGDEKSA